MDREAEVVAYQLVSWMTLLLAELLSLPLAHIFCVAISCIPSPWQQASTSNSAGCPRHK